MGYKNLLSTIIRAVFCFIPTVLIPLGGELRAYAKTNSAAETLTAMQTAACQNNWAEAIELTEILLRSPELPADEYDLLSSFRQQLMSWQYTSTTFATSNCKGRDIGRIHRRYECRKLITAMNETLDNVQTVRATAGLPGSNVSSTEVITRISTVVEQGVITLQALELIDPQLQGFRQRYGDMYSALGESTRSMIRASETRDQELGRQAYEAFINSTAPEGALVDEVNAYCS